MVRDGGDRYRPDYGRPHERPVTLSEGFQSQSGGAYDSYRPDRFAQLRQVDSWRPPRNDESHSRTATNSQSSHHISVDSAAVAHSRIQSFYYTPYQPLRVSDGTRERQIIQQAQSRFSITQPQDTPRYQLRERRPEQIAPYSTAAAGRRAQDGTSPVPRRSQPSGWTAEVESPPAPVASEEYKRRAALAPALRETPQKLLVILDLNGTLLVRPQRHRPKYIIVRPGVRKLLDYLFQNHVVMVYSSAKPENCAAMVNQFFHPTQRSAMAGVWARDKLGLSKLQYNSKVQVYKKLEPIWKDKKIGKKAGPGQKWDQSNTVLVDDSQLKGLAQPHNLLQIPEFFNDAPREGGQALLDWQREQEQIVYSVQQKLEELKWQVDVSRSIRQWQTGQRQAPGVVDETVDQKALQGTAGRELSPTPSIGSPVPSVGEHESSVSQQVQSLDASVQSDIENSKAYEPGGGFGDVNTAADVTFALDELEKHIDRSLNLNQNQDRGTHPAVGSSTATTGVAGPAVKDRVHPPRKAKKKKKPGMSNKVPKSQRKREIKAAAKERRRAKQQARAQAASAASARKEVRGGKKRPNL
ncbi:hypothetical protein AYL99_08955 [Fonsecaea erecta]|uniref:Mitochondrial import inner membrane translocase subunit TIM50 n=1 Tax=Fonsecaea erecta TaxID=1367422 RepID=A0A178ZCD0_9EURO|nr:hypothetical protein AYL99_08955 [Fonsecaea erecta]OAP56843.1 hypothetical protein AYL99_08955 [Fonsecaea erecta]